MAYVASRYVDNLRRNEAVDDGRYSDVEGEVIESGATETLEAAVCALDLRVFRERMATRWGADFVRDSSLEVAGGFDCLGVIPYFASVE